MIGSSTDHDIDVKTLTLALADDAPLCSLSNLWFVNCRGHAINPQWSEQFIKVLLDAEIPLYYMDDDFDSDAAFTEYRLSESTSADVRMQVNCAEFEELSLPRGCMAAEHFTKNVREEIRRRELSCPLWLDLLISVRAVNGAVMNSTGPFPVASLLVKIRDVKSTCQLQGVGGFYWPTEYPFLRTGQFVGNKMENGLWQRAIQNITGDKRGRKAASSTHVDVRVECVLAALKKHRAVLGSVTRRSGPEKLPPVKQIYRLVRNDPSFYSHGSSARGPISFSTFNQQWKEQLRTKVLAHFEAG